MRRLPFRRGCAGAQATSTVRRRARPAAGVPDRHRCDGPGSLSGGPVWRALSWVWPGSGWAGSDGPVPASVHTADCNLAGPLSRAVSGMDARVAIVDGQLWVCAFCHSDAAFGVDFD
ncbi:DUF6233 domain-containing protein [Streptomyces albiflavescens]|uniref:DUF6233 domain-containing protein n=1 Tax=Streptomyces albiflavescens TaxID=1623582 RepID=UPI0035712767